jgi:outer membrane protein OmpA-like peptidoglycan-associated protein
MKKSKIILIYFVCIINFGYAQKKVKFEIAQKYCEKLAYSEAIPYLEDYLNDVDNLDAQILLAKCYKSINDYANAELWLNKVVTNPKNVDNTQNLLYAQVLQNNQKYDEAAKWYKVYLDKNPTSTIANNQYKACTDKELFKDSLLYLVEKVGFNTEGYDYGACIDDNKFYYTSTNQFNTNDVKLDKYTNEPFMDVNEVTFDTEEFTFSNGKPSTLGTNTKYHEGPICITEDKKYIYFTRNDYTGGGSNKKLGFSDDRIVNLKIYRADYSNNIISNEIELPFNNSEYSCGHPAFDNKTQRLYFVSDMPGGFGETDIWYVDIKDNQYSTPINLGTKINTEGKEMFPSIENDILYFSSNGHPGLGGLDIFKIGLKNLEKDKIINLCHPVNTSFDDFSVLMQNNGKIGFISSNRPDSKGLDDIFLLVYNIYELEVQVVNKATGEPIANAQITQFLDSKLISENISDKNGTTTMEVRGTSTFLFLADASNFLPSSKSITIEPSKKSNKVFLKIELDSIPAKIIVIDEFTKQPISNANVNISNTCNTQKHAAQTNTDGVVYENIKENCNLNISANAIGYFPNSKAVMITKPNDTLDIIIELRSVNADIIVLKNIYYDFDKSDIREDAIGDLKYLYAFLKSNPSAIVELSSHTDARGDNKYNLILSQKRADAAKAWLVNKGINPQNIKAVGFGESKPVNNCINDVACTEEEHQYNRRTEFRVLNAGAVLESKENKDITISKCTDCEF